jgi:hypothetical protein
MKKQLLFVVFFLFARIICPKHYRSKKDLLVLRKCILSIYIFYL